MEHRIATPELVGHVAFLRDIHCGPKETGDCRIIAMSSKGPEWVVIEMTSDYSYVYKAGHVAAIKLSWLDVR